MMMFYCFILIVECQYYKLFQPVRSHDWTWAIFCSLFFVCIFFLLTGPGEPFTLWRLSVLSLRQRLSAVQSGFQSLPKCPQAGLLHLADNIFIRSSRGWRWIEILHPRFANATQNGADELTGQSWNWLQSRQVTNREEILTWEELLLLQRVPACGLPTLT